MRRSALQVAAIQNNVEATRCLLTHGADGHNVDLDACGEEAAALIREAIAETTEAAAAGGAQAPLAAEERAKYARECFALALPALLQVRIPESPHPPPAPAPAAPRPPSLPTPSPPSRHPLQALATTQSPSCTAAP